MPYQSFSRALPILAGLIVCTASVARSDEPERVTGYFCGAKNEQIAFLQREAAGESEEIAANTVNKSVGMQTCAFFLPADAIPTKDQTVMSEGVLFKVQGYVFLPEKVERWTGSYFGSFQPTESFSQL